MSRLVFAISATVCLFGAFALLLTPTSLHLQIPFRSGSTSGRDPISLASFYEDVPYASTWQSWWNPRRGGKPSIERDWNLLYHLGGNGPWIEKIDGIVEGGIGVPKGCRVEQVHMVCRLAASTGNCNAAHLLMIVVVNPVVAPCRTASNSHIRWSWVPQPLRSSSTM